MSNSIVGALFDKRLTIIAAIFLAVAMVFTAAPASAADNAQPDVVVAPANGQAKPEGAKPADKKDALPVKGAGNDADAAKAAKDDAEAAARLKRAAEREAADAAREEAFEAQRQETARKIEELKKQGWVVGPVKDKSELPPIKMVFIKGGCFEMGDWTGDGDEDERPAHKTCVSNFYLAETEVTQKLYEAVTGIIPSSFVDPDKPVTNLKHYKLKHFFTELNKLTGRFYRLPTEAEWEYAARNGGKNVRWAGTDNENDLSDYAWFGDNSMGVSQKVKQKKPNELGLYDMSGNVWERMEDYFDFEYYGRSPKRDPLNAEYTTWFAIRGGSYGDSPFLLRTTYRLGIELMKTAFAPDIGIRLAE